MSSYLTEESEGAASASPASAHVDGAGPTPGLHRHGILPVAHQSHPSRPALCIPMPLPG